MLDLNIFLLTLLFSISAYSQSPLGINALNIKDPHICNRIFTHSSQKVKIYIPGISNKEIIIDNYKELPPNDNWLINQRVALSGKYNLDKGELNHIITKIGTDIVNLSVNSKEFRQFSIFYHANEMIKYLEKLAPREWNIPILIFYIEYHPKKRTSLLYRENNPKTFGVINLFQGFVGSIESKFNYVALDPTIIQHETTHAYFHYKKFTNGNETSEVQDFATSAIDEASAQYFTASFNDSPILQKYTFQRLNQYSNLDEYPYTNLSSVIDAIKHKDYDALLSKNVKFQDLIHLYGDIIAHELWETRKYLLDKQYSKQEIDTKFFEIFKNLFTGDVLVLNLQAKVLQQFNDINENEINHFFKVTAELDKVFNTQEINSSVTFFDHFLKEFLLKFIVDTKFRGGKFFLTQMLNKIEKICFGLHT